MNESLRCLALPLVIGFLPQLLGRGGISKKAPGLPKTAVALSPPAIRQAASELQVAGVVGILDGLKVGGICLVTPA